MRFWQGIPGLLHAKFAGKNALLEKKSGYGAGLAVI